MQHRTITSSGFTLIELSIVLVIIGLIVGGILTGQDLIAAAKIRAQASQLEKFSAAVNAFKLKYTYLPGDIPWTEATNYGLPIWQLAMNPGTAANGDGIYNGGSNSTSTLNTSTDEFVTFWPDLSYSGLIGGNFSCNGWVNSCRGIPGAIYDNSTLAFPANINIYFPAMKLGNFGIGPISVSKFGGNFFALGITTYTLASYNIGGGHVASLTPLQAQQLDQKIDDGIPISGSVRAIKYTNATDPYGNYYTEYAIAVDDNNPVASNCTISGGLTYNVANSKVACTMIVKIQ